MLGGADLISMIAVVQADKARAFYEETLGLEFVREEPQALVFRGNGRYLRVQRVDKLPPATGSVLGWQVDDIESTARALAERGVELQRYDGMRQDDLGIATFPNGDKVAWFLDPDGNVLSVAQLVPTTSSGPQGTSAGDMVPKLFRVILQVSDVEHAARFYGTVLAMPGERVSPGRHYFQCGETILACFDPRADGDPFDASPNPDHVYLAVPDLEATFERARKAGCRSLDERIETQPWGERSFYAVDPFGNKLCFVDASTVFTGH